jgi:hypothetical protein
MERNKHIFASLHHNEFQVASSIKQDIHMYNLAFRVE